MEERRGVGWVEVCAQAGMYQALGYVIVKRGSDHKGAPTAACPRYWHAPPGARLPPAKQRVVGGEGERGEQNVGVLASAALQCKSGEVRNVMQIPGQVLIDVCGGACICAGGIPLTRALWNA